MRNIQLMLSCPGIDTTEQTTGETYRTLLLSGGDDAADTCDAMLSLCDVRRLTPGEDTEFWHRLAGNVRKARGMV